MIDMWQMLSAQLPVIREVASFVQAEKLPNFEYHVANLLQKQ